MTRDKRRSGTALAGVVAAATTAIFASTLTPALAQAPFAGKTIDLIVSTGAGGGQDSAARVVARHWVNHIPGKPTMVVKNMPGAGHIRAANFLANQAPKDGTAIGAIVPAFLLAQVIETSKAIQFDAAKFQWIGASSANNSTVYVWSASPVQDMAGAMKQEVLMGATGAGSYTQIYPMILNAVVGTRFKVIAGYGAAAEVNLAMERGEVHGRAGNNFNSLRMENPEWLREGKVRFLAQVGLTTVPGHLVGVPRIAESPVALECVPMHYLELGAGRVIVAARVLSVYVDDQAVLDAGKCQIDTPVLDLIGRMHGRGEYAYTRELFTMLRPAGQPGSPSS